MADALCRRATIRPLLTSPLDFEFRSVTMCGPVVVIAIAIALVVAAVVVVVVVVIVVLVVVVIFASCMAEYAKHGEVA